MQTTLHPILIYLRTLHLIFTRWPMESNDALDDNQVFGPSVSYIWKSKLQFSVASIYSYPDKKADCQCSTARCLVLGASDLNLSQCPVIVIAKRGCLMQTIYRERRNRAFAFISGTGTRYVNGANWPSSSEKGLSMLSIRSYDEKRV